MSGFEWKRWKSKEVNEAELSASGGASTPPQGRSAEESTHFEVSCDNYAPLLTALFDDEATAEEEHIARLHLERCDHCAQMWRDWENSQLIWRAMPAAKLPPGLLLRILTACRVAAMRPKFGFKTNNARRALARRVPPLAGLFPEVAPPANLQEEILRRTVYAASRDAEYSHRNPLSSFSLWKQQVSRWGVAVAVPASLMWIMFASDSDQSVWQATETAQQNTVIQTAPNRARLTQNPKATPLSANPLSKVNSLAKVLNTRRSVVLPKPTETNASEGVTDEKPERSLLADAPVSVTAPGPQVVSTRVISEPLASESAAAISRPTMRPLVTASVQFAALGVPVKNSLPKTPISSTTAKVLTSAVQATPRSVSTSRRATSRAKIERAVVHSSSRERAALLARTALRIERRTPGPSVSTPDVVLASLPMRMAAASEARPLGAANSSPASEATELEMDDTIRFASSETEELHAMLSEYQDALLSDEDASS